MSSLQNRIIPFVLKWVPLLCARNRFISTDPYLHCNGLCRILQHHRFASTERGVNLAELARNSRVVREEAEAALVEYFHFTRSFEILDAENMSRNTPHFLDKLFRSVEIGDAKVGHSLTRFLRYHPISEFEPFFESIGLKPSEYSSFLPQNLMFLSDDELLMENYHILCNYGIERNRIGRIYRDAREVFGYAYGVLLPKLRSFQDLMVRKSFALKIIASSPQLLVGKSVWDFIEVLENLKKVGIESEWLEEHINVEDDPYHWRRMLELMNLLRKLGLNEDQLSQLLTFHPEILLERSGLITLCLFGFMLKFGSTQGKIRNLLLEFPDISLMKFTRNFWVCYKFLLQIGMNDQDISSIICAYPMLLGSCKLKKINTLKTALSCGQNSICRMVMDDPYVLKKWVIGGKVNRLYKGSRFERSLIQKTEFLSSLGFVENSEKMEKALKKIHGSGVNLHERFDCFLKLGLTREEVIKMIKAAPHIVNQSAELIEAKVGFFVKELGCPVSDLVGYPRLLCFTIERVKLRLLMYRWLMCKCCANLALSTVLSCTEETFVQAYVKSHPKGYEHWNRLKKQVCCQ